MDIHQYFSLCSIVIAVSFNIILLFLIVRYSSERIGNYKYFLFAYTLNAALYSSSQIGILENWIVPQGGGYFFFATIQIIPKWAQIWTITLFISLFHMNLFIVSWGFLYRLSILKQSQFFEQKWKMLLLIIATGVLESCTVMDAWLIHPTERTDKEFEATIVNTTGKNISEVGYIGGPFKYGDKINLNLAVALSVNGGVNAFVNAFIVYCWFGIRNKLRENKRSTRSNRIHYRLYFLLTLQSLFPIVFNATPVIIAFTFSALDIDVGRYLLLCGDAMNIAQVLDPVCIVFFVTDYKRAILKFLFRGTSYEQRIAPTTALSATSKDNNSNRKSQEAASRDQNEY